MNNYDSERRYSEARKRYDAYFETLTLDQQVAEIHRLLIAFANAIVLPEPKTTQQGQKAIGPEHEAHTEQERINRIADDLLANVDI